MVATIMTTAKDRDVLSGPVTANMLDQAPHVPDCLRISERLTGAERQRPHGQQTLPDYPQGSQALFEAAG